MYNIENKICKVCFEKIPMPRPRDKIKEFCGRKCVAIFYAPLKSKQSNLKNIIPCKNCNTLFKIGSGKQFCSRKCYGEFSRITHYRNCERCGVQFILYNIAYERRGGGRFCSVECGTRKLEFNEEYFKKIDTSEKAYWLGFLFADGCIDKRKTQMKINLGYLDRDHLEKFRIALNAEHTVKIYECKDSTDNKKASFFIGSKKIVDDLCNLGCVPGKTFILQYPNIPLEFNSHFIRGFFDGDGCIYLSKTLNKKNKKPKYKNITIYSAANSFLEKICEILQNEANIDVNTYKRKADRVGLTFTINKKTEIEKFFYYIYNNSTIHLQRKYDKFII